MVDVEQVKLRRLHMWQRHRLVHHLNVVGEDVDQRIGATAIGHVQDVDAGLVAQHLEAQMRPGAGTRRAEGELARILLGVLEHLLECLHADRRMDDEAGHHVAEAGNRGKALGIVGYLAQQRQVDRRRVRGHQQRVAVGGCLHRGLGADQAARAASVLDDELLAEDLPELVAPRPSHNVGAAAGREWHDDLDRFIRPRRLRRGPARGAGRRRADRHRQEFTTPQQSR